MVCQPWSGRGLFGTPAPIRRSLLQVVAQSLDLVDQEVDVGARGRRVGDDHAEEVDLLTLRLVAHHGGPTLHHQSLDLRSHLHATGRTYADHWLVEQIHTEHRLVWQTHTDHWLV